MMKTKKTKNRYEINDKVEYSIKARIRISGLRVLHSRMYCHGYVKSIRDLGIFGVYYVLKDAKSERVDIVNARNVYGKIVK